MSDHSSSNWLASALGLNAAGNTGSNLSSLPPLVIHSMDYFTDPDYLKPKDKKDMLDAQCTAKMQPVINGVQEVCSQPVTRRLLDSSFSSLVQSSCDRPASEVLQTHKRTRVRIAKWQLDVLESEFAVTKYVTRTDNQRLKKQLKLSCDQIRSWFKRRRREEKQVSSKTSQQSALLPKTVLSTQMTSQVLFYNQNLQCSSNAPSSQYYTSSSSSHHSPQSNTPSCKFEKHAGILKERDDEKEE